MTVLSPAATAIHPARSGPRPMNAEDLWSIPRVGSPEPAPDGKSLVVPVTTYDLEKNEGTTRLWRVPLTGGEPVALTSADKSSGAPAFSPDGTKLAFTRKGTKGKNQLHVMPLDGGEAECVTELPLGVFDPKWLPDGSGIVFAATLLKGHLTPEATATEAERRDKDPVKAYVTEDRFYRYWDTWLTTGEVPHLFLWDMATRKLRDLTPTFDGWFDWMEPAGQYDIAPDGKEIAFAAMHYHVDKREQRAAIWTVPVAGGEPKCLTPDHPSDDHLPRYTPDGKAIVYGMQHDRQFYADRVRMMRYDRASGAHASLFDWDLSPAKWRFAKGGTLYLETERAARLCVFAWSGGGAPKLVSGEGCASGTAALADGRIVFVRQDMANAPEVFACAADGTALARVTHFTDEASTKFATGEVREMQFVGAKGETVQMFVAFPAGYDPAKKYPLIQCVHGGPHATSADAFHWRWNVQAFTAPGYIAAMVNFQGSTSWGQDFAQRIQGAWAERPFEDVMRSTDVLIEAGLVDATKMAAIGGSYGGYMAAWIAGHTDRFKCIVNHAGVFNTLSQYASDWTLGRSKAFGGEPWDGLEAISACNPAHAAKGFVTPMLVIHGEKDYRVPVTQGLECYGVLRAKGVAARLVYFPDENHWILKPRNSTFWYGEVLGWLGRWLG